MEAGLEFVAGSTIERYVVVSCNYESDSGWVSYLRIGLSRRCSYRVAHSIGVRRLVPQDGGCLFPCCMYVVPILLDAP